jgi:hypothetical protein
MASVSGARRSPLPAASIIADLIVIKLPWE